MTVHSESAPANDQLFECLYFALSFYDSHTNLQATINEIPRASGPLEPAELPFIAKQLSFNAHTKKRTLKSLHNTDIPCILFLKDRKAVVLLPQRTHGGKIYIPGQGITEQNSEDLQEEYTGYVSFIFPQATFGASEKRSNAHSWIWKPIAEHWASYAEVMLCSFFINIFALALPLFTMNVYDKVVPNYATETLLVLAIGILLAITLDFLFKITRSYILERLSTHIGTRFDFELMGKILHIRSAYMKYSIGELSNIFKEIQTLRDFYATRLAPSCVDLPFFFLFIFVIGSLSWALVIVPISAAAVIFTLNLFAHIPIKSRNAKHFKDSQNKSAFLIDILSGAETLKMFNALGAGLFRWNMVSAQSSASAQKTNFLTGSVQSISIAIMQLVNVFVITLGVYEIHQGNLTVGGLIACTILSARAMGPVMAMSGTFSNVKHVRDVIDTINNLLSLPHDNENDRYVSENQTLKGEISFNEVSFSYPGQTIPALRDVSFTIQPGEKVAIIGPTGAGKSTLVKLGAGFVKPTSGNIIIDNYKIENLHATDVRKTFGIVPQGAFFFKDSLRKNITLGHDDIAAEKIEAAIRFSGLEQYVQKMGQGIDFDIGEHGNKLSGGQKQSVALARVFLHNPAVYILDEPTNGMDQAMENKIKQNITEELREKTLILITHRTSLLSLVDRIILLDQGRIVMDGPRDSIMKRLAGETA